MKRLTKITIICPVEIDDDVDATNETKLDDALSEAVEGDLFTTGYLSRWHELEIEDMGESQESEDNNGT